MASYNVGGWGGLQVGMGQDAAISQLKKLCTQYRGDSGEDCQPFYGKSSTIIIILDSGNVLGLNKRVKSILIDIEYDNNTLNQILKEFGSKWPLEKPYYCPIKKDDWHWCRAIFANKTLEVWDKWKKRYNKRWITVIFSAKAET